MPEPDIQRSGQAELEAWVGTRRDQLVRTAIGILKDRDEAEDLVQDTLLKVWQRMGSVELQRPGAYLIRSVYWNALKQRARRRISTSLETAELEVADRSICRDSEQHILDPLELELAIAELPVTQQATIRLRFYLGLTFAEIGKCLTISSSTAASRCRYALVSLRRLLDRRSNREDE